MIESTSSTLFIKKNEAELKIGHIPHSSLYDMKYIEKEGKLLSPRDLNDLFALHSVTHLPWLELIRDYIK